MYLRTVQIRDGLPSIFDSDDLLTSNLAAQALEKLVDVPDTITCHDLISAFVQVFAIDSVRLSGITMESGMCFGILHSWIRLPSGQILDLYPIGIMISSNVIPMVVDVRTPLPYRNRYVVLEGWEPPKNDGHLKFLVKELTKIAKNIGA